jgi:hypothetical protein
MTQGISKLTSVPARALPTRMQVPRPRSPWLKRQASAAARRSARFVFEQARVYLSQLKAIEGDWRHQSPNRGRRNARTGATKASREDARRLRAVMAVIGILGAGCQHQVFLALVGSEAGLDLSRRPAGSARRPIVRQVDAVRTDSSLEGSGFELLVPGEIGVQAGSATCSFT